MNLFEPEHTPWDLNFRLCGIPVRIHPLFWLTTVILGSNILRREEVEPPVRLLYLGLWVACVLVSILAHEMGHVVVGQMYGNRGYIVLTGFFGLAIGCSNLPGRWQRVAVAFAGPLAGFLLLGAVGLLCSLLYDPNLFTFLMAWQFNIRAGFFDPAWSEWVVELLHNLIFINLFWGLINLLPIWPLDGGKISRELFEHFVPDRALRGSLMLSLVTASLLAINGLIGCLWGEPFIPFLPTGTWFTVIFFGIFAYGSWQLLQMTPPSGGGWSYHRADDDYERLPWERDPDWWKRR